VLGASWVAAMLGPFPDQRFVVTGGMTMRSAEEFLAAGARTVAVGDAFDDDEQLTVIRTVMASSRGDREPGSVAG
jgi:2-dehydro-3-deoxyphosphogluconate aldolase / (4S)-4-hydroxy-2-oxoglutarate aldolase